MRCITGTVLLVAQLLFVFVAGNPIIIKGGNSIHSYEEWLVEHADHDHSECAHYYDPHHHHFYECDWSHAVPQNEAVDQKACSACWAFALAALVETTYYKLTGDLIKVSEGFLVDCLGGNGCTGGHPADGIRFLQDHQYVAGYGSYKWSGEYSGGCLDKAMSKKHNVLSKVWITGYRKVHASVEALIDALNVSPVIVNMYVSREIFAYKTGIWEDLRCLYEPYTHSMLVVGYSDTDWLIRNSYGSHWGEDGYVRLARTETAISCNMLSNMITIDMIPRREIKYTIGKGLQTYKGAARKCAAGKATLAVIPTEMHWKQVLALFQTKFGKKKKSKPDFNYTWIGIRKATDDDAMWVDDETPVTFNEYHWGEPKYNFVRMSRKDGQWSGSPSYRVYRYVCSTYI